MDFALTEEQQLIVRTTREFVETELYPHEQQVELTGELDEAVRQRAAQPRRSTAGLFAANMPAEVGGAGLDTVTWILYEKELGPHELYPALRLCGAALEHSVGL